MTFYFCHSFTRKISQYLLLALLSFLSFAVNAATYNLSTGVYPPCIGGNGWSVGGGTYTCNNGRVTLGAGDIITANANSTIVSHNGFSLASNTTIGTTGVSINLTSGYGTITSTGTTTIYGAVNAGSSSVTLVNATVNNSVIAGGAINLTGGSISGTVNSSNDGVTTSNTTINGAITASGAINLTGGSVSGAVNSTNSGVTTSNTTIGGALSANGNINLTGGSVTGLVTSTNNTITTNGTNLSNGATAQSGMSITGGTVAGNFTMTSNNQATFSAVTMTSGSISGASTVTIQNGSLIGSSSSAISITSNSGPVNVNNATVYGSLTAPNYSTVNVTNGGQVFGTCTPGSTPASACSTAPTNVCPDGFSSGITGYYYNNMTLTEPNTATRSDGPINFNWGTAAPGPTGIGADNFSVRWNGYIRATTSGVYRFRTVSDDGVRLYVNGNLVINRWNDHSSTTDTTGDIQLVAGQTYSIVLEYYENGGSAVIQLSWLTPGSSAYVAIPAGPTPTMGSGLYECTAIIKPPVSSCSTSLTAGITGKYYNNMLASGTVVATRSDGPINFDWGTGAPGPTGVNADNFSVSWDGYLRVSQSGTYRFQTNSDDGIRLTVNGDLLINQWNDHSVATHTSAAVSLNAGSSYPIKLEYYENGGFAVAQLLWQTPAGGSYIAIPRGSSPVANAGLYECVTTPADYVVTNNASGITCAAEMVTVTARNASGNAFNPPAGTVVSLGTSPATGVWVGGNTYTFSGSESSFVKYLQQTTPATLSITAASATATGSSSITFADVGLKIAQNTALNPIPTQISAVNGSAVVRVVRTNTTTGACEARIGAGSRPVSLAYSCINPSSCISGQTFTVNGTAITGNNNGASVNYSSVNLTFNSSGEAPLTINYSDAGQVRLFGALTLAASGNDPAITMTGNSDPFVVKPHTLATSAITNASGTTATPGTTNSGAGFIAAGERFRVLVQARNANGNLTPNFGNESVSEKDNMTLVASTLVYPTGGTLTELTNNGNFTATTPAGTFVNQNLQWNQVGSIRIRPRLGDNDYLSAGDIPNYSDGNIVAGRFFPENFFMPGGTVTNSCSSFSYMADPKITINYTLQARTQAGIILTNYDNNDQAQFYSAAMATPVYSAENADSGNGNAAFNSRLGVMPSKWSKGIMSVNTTTASFGRVAATGAPDGPYSNLQLGVGIVDTFDSRSLNGLNMNSATTGACSGAGCTAVTVGSPLNMLYGRLRLEDAFGPASTDLPVNFYTEFWAGNFFVKNTNDNCTRVLRSAISYPAGIILNSANLTVPLTGGNTTGQYATITATEIGFTGGDARQRFSAPANASTTGFFNVNVDLSGYPWLQFDWNQDGNFSDTSLPTARFGFGNYRGHDRVIYWRERF